jgi:hypothetical protein
LPQHAYGCVMSPRPSSARHRVDAACSSSVRSTVVNLSLSVTIAPHPSTKFGKRKRADDRNRTA